MSGASSRRLKNPLLSAADTGFAFESYEENALLVPVTPATPAVLRDDPDLDNFIGQEASSPQAAFNQPTQNVDLGPAILQPEENKNLGSSKQGYFTSILSSWPNLSLSSITGDSSGVQGTENSAKPQNSSPYVPSHDPRTNFQGTVHQNPLDPRVPGFSGPGEVNLGPGGTLSTPPQPVLPPAASPASSEGAVSYRLGNQRRLKYAPPPDLTSNTSRQYPTPSTGGFFSPPNTVTPTIFNPNETIAPVQPSVPSSQGPQYPSFDQLSQNSSLQSSYRSSPVASGTPNIDIPGLSTSGKPKLAVSCSKPIPTQSLEPATPQNTPANFSFSGFDLYTSQRDLQLAASNLIVEDPSKESLKTISHSQIPKDNLFGAGEIRQEDSVRTVDSTFAPISAVKVSEKLEHLLAEQQEQSGDSPVGDSSRANENIAVTGQVSESQKGLKSEDPRESSVPTKETLTDVALNQEPELKVLEAHVPVSTEIQIKPNPKIHEEEPKSNVLSLESHVETQSSFSEPNFFASQPEHTSLNLKEGRPSSAAISFFTDPEPTKASLNYVPGEPSVLSSFSTASGAFPQSTKSYFDSPQPVESHSPFGLSQSNASQSATANKSSVEAAVPVPQSLWGPSPVKEPVASSGLGSQPQGPIFYDPTQFQNGSYKSPTVESDLAQVNPSQQYFNQFSVQSQPYSPSSVDAGLFSPISSPHMATVAPEPTGSATLSPVQMSVNPLSGRHTPDTVPPSLQTLAAGSDRRTQYRPVYHHWFYRKEVEHKVLWLPFSMQDSLQLEEIHNSSEIAPETTVATDGGRYDVNILRRKRSSVYWAGSDSEVRRCSWFYKGPTESKYVPYDESTAAKLEEEYKQACTTNNWNRRIDLNNGEYIIFHTASVQVHYSQSTTPELAASWGNSAVSEDSTYLQGAATRPRVIKRGLDEFHIEDGEPEQIDHLLFLVHGIGSVCDLKFRSVEEVVDEFRSISQQLVQSHYRTASEQRIVNRIEVLPISWHTTLHSDDTGIDKKLQAITLESIPKLRHFTNDTLLDILFYTSPVYCQTIIQAVGSELNRLYTLFKERNPEFQGGIYLGGHSLGSLILFDLLCHQKPLLDKSPEEDEAGNDDQEEKKTDENASPLKPLSPPVLKRRLSKRISYVVGAAGTGQPFIQYPQLTFNPRAFFALGSPIGMFVTIRGIDTLGEDFKLPTCPAFFNIFHPFDPVAYRVESLIHPDAHKYRPMLIPHHKGRKRMHLELKETMARVGADLKQRLLDSVRNTWNSVYQLALFHKPDNQALEREIDKVVEEQLQNPPSLPEHQATDDGGADLKVGRLNGGRRIDYVLQEAPFEYINEYIFALTSHVCYWESEDTMLMILKEIYGSVGIQTDAQLPQQTMTIERPSPARSTPVHSPSLSLKSDISSPVPLLGIDPTMPVVEKPIGPPPKTGFVRKS